MDEIAKPPPSKRLSPRDVFTVLWVTLVFLITLWLLFEIRRILIWLFVAVFLASVLSPLVKLLTRRGMRRGFAVGLVISTLLVVGSALAYVFIRPLVDQATAFAKNLPELIEQVRQTPAVERVVERYNIQDRIEQTSSDLPKRLLGLSSPLLSAFKTVGHVVVAGVSIFVLTIFLLLYGPSIVEAGLRLVPDRSRRKSLRQLGQDMLKGVSGWVAGNLLTSVIAAVCALVVFLLVGLPYGFLLALWVGMADLIPLVGATLGALPAVIVAFVDSTATGVIVTLFFIAYQQLENHVLQPYVYGRTIQLNPFIVLISILVGVELAGFLGALLALPVAGAINVLISHLRDEDILPLGETQEPAGEQSVPAPAPSADGARSAPSGEKTAAKPRSKARRKK